MLAADIEDDLKRPVVRVAAHRVPSAADLLWRVADALEGDDTDGRPQEGGDRLLRAYRRLAAAASEAEGDPVVSLTDGRVSSGHVPALRRPEQIQAIITARVEFVDESASWRDLVRASRRASTCFSSTPATAATCAGRSASCTTRSPWPQATPPSWSSAPT